MKAGNELAIPPHFQGIFAIDMRGPEAASDHLEVLLRAIFKVPALTAPPLGPPPAFAQAAAGEAKPIRPVRLSTLEFDGWALVSGVALNEQYPDTFSIPTAEQRSSVIPTDFVKLNFAVAANAVDNDGVSVVGERMWVKVVGAYGPYLWGTLSNQPSFDGKGIGLEHGSEIIFLPEHIIDIVDAAQQEKDEEELMARGKRTDGKVGKAKSKSKKRLKKGPKKH
jgi:hypothetical protein